MVLVFWLQLLLIAQVLRGRQGELCQVLLWGYAVLLLVRVEKYRVLESLSLIHI